MPSFGRRVKVVGGQTATICNAKLGLPSNSAKTGIKRTATNKRMPYGLSHAGATFQRLVHKVIGPELEPYAFSYLDDIIIATETYEEHLKWLEHVLKRIKEARLTVNREKSVFGKTKVKYLGVLVNRDGFRPDSEIQPMLKDFATITEPLTALTKKDRRYEWGDTQQEAFEKTKALVSSVPVLARPSFETQFVVQTDASDTGIGAVLLQIIDGQERVLEFAS